MSADGVTACVPLRIGNASGFYGDRFAAVREMLTGGELDVLTGDYLAELTMLILGKDRIKDPAARVRQDVPAPDGGVPRLAVERGVKIVTNAGGLNPAGLAEPPPRARRRPRVSTSTSPTSRATTCWPAPTSSASARR